MNVVEKILSEHLVEGEMVAGSEIGIRIDQTLTQDATGTTAMLLFESMGLDRVRTELSVSYVDHNMAMFGPENHDDHLYLQSIAGKVGVYHSRPGNGICHQVHLERFARPGMTLLGSDSHTPTSSGIGAIAIGAGGGRGGGDGRRGVLSDGATGDLPGERPPSRVALSQELERHGDGRAGGTWF